MSFDIIQMGSAENLPIEQRRRGEATTTKLQNIFSCLVACVCEYETIEESSDETVVTNIVYVI